MGTLKPSHIAHFFDYFFYAGSTFEEYVTLADYKPKSEGELSVKAGEVVKVINREATGKTRALKY